MQDMLTIIKHSLAIALGLTLTNINISPINAQTDTRGDIFLEDIEAGEEVNWNFSSEDESTSIKDDIKGLGEYSSSETESETEIDLELVEEDSRWGNRGDAEDYSIEAEFYDY